MKIEEVPRHELAKIKMPGLPHSAQARSGAGEEASNAFDASAHVSYLRQAEFMLNEARSNFENSGIASIQTDSDLSEIADGRYDGGNHLLALELRVDFDGSGVVSGDIFGTSFGQRDYLASFRTAPGTKVTRSDQNPWTLVFEERESKAVTGSGELLQGVSGSSLRLVLRIDGAIDGLPANREFELIAEWKSKHLRRLGIELEREAGTDAPPTYDFNGRNVTYERAFEDAGFEVFDAGVSSSIPREPDGWGTAQLHALMTDHAQSSLTRAAWRQQLLWLGKPSRRGLLGVMFDTTALLPRQGTAVFDTEIRDLVPNEVERKIIQTTMHELGHGLNLAHRFEREVGRADSKSIMNYGWRYKGGGKEPEFWEKFDFSFDPDELEFLRHAPRNAVIPGGAAFHSVNYWADGNGGYSPYVPEVPLDILDLRLEAPIGGPVFAFGQPVLLGVELTNLSNQDLNLDRRFLDPKTGFLEIRVRKVEGTAGAKHSARHFHPMLERCFDFEASVADVVSSGQSISDNLNLTFGSGGFTFAEPGRYEVQAIVAIYDNRGDQNPNNDRELIVPSNWLTIHIAHPTSRVEEEEVVTVLQREDVGTWFALGGSSALEEAENVLSAVLDRRLHGEDSVTDPIAANIIRCKGIDAGRRYRRFQRGRYRATNGKPDVAASLLAKLTEPAMKAFDRSTAAATKRLCEKHAKRAKAAAKSK
ncbi:hypothetical protein IWQ54_006584 [Labrenzia sp. EL_195]|nr:hypothetical protein [Labrenzia sp. EL_195]